MENKEYQELNIDGTVYKTLLTKKYKQRKSWNARCADEIRTMIPGTVVSLNVKEGDMVNAGDVLLLFEAMKMQNLILAPHSGTVRELVVKAGDKLPKDALIMKIEA